LNADTAVTAPSVAAPQAAPEMPVRSAPAAVAAAVQAPQAAPAALSRELPKVQRFALPLDELARVAEHSGLQWVNSDAEKIAAVQAAIAAEPKAARVPRERPAPVQIEQSPLVLVETKRDLSDMALPFEQTKAS
jgi:ribonuclease E